MCNLIFDQQVLHLTVDFYNDYPNPPYREILEKTDRPYNCLLLQSNYDYFICIPYRTEITHPNAYKFTFSQRSIEHNSGLDYTKIVIVSETNSHYIGTTTAVVDADEYRETMCNINQIIIEANVFINDYVRHCNGSAILHQAEFLRKYRYSTLMYFHNELHI